MYLVYIKNKSSYIVFVTALFTVARAGHDPATS
jgi:hypothetical protein